MQERFEDWLNENDHIIGGTVLVIGDQEMELKFAQTIAFTSRLSRDEIIYDFV